MAAFEINKKRIASNTIALYIRTAISMVISFVAARVTLQQLGVEDYGLNNLVGSVVAMFSFINGSMGTAVQRFYNIEIGRNADNTTQLKKVFGVALYLHIWVAIITFVLAELFAFFFLYKLNIPAERQQAAQIVFQISIISLVLNILLVPYSSLLRAREMFAQMATIDILQSLFRFGVLFLLIYSNYDKLITLSILNLCITVFYVGALFVLAWHYRETHSSPCRDKQIVSEMLTFISMLVLSLFAQIFKDKGIVMIINIFYGLVLNAAYAVAMQVSSMVSTFVLNFQQSVVPQLMSSYGAGDKRNMINLINLGTKISVLLLLIISLPIIVESNYLLKIWLKNPPEYSSVLVQLVMINIIVFSFEYFLAQGVHATGKLVRLQSFCSGAFLLTIVFMYIMCKLGHSILLPMIVNIACSFIVLTITLIEAKRIYDYQISFFILHIFLPCILASVFILCVLYGFSSMIEESFVRAILVFLISTVLTIFVGFCFIFDSTERKQLWSLVNSKFSALN